MRAASVEDKRSDSSAKIVVVKVFMP